MFPTTKMIGTDLYDMDAKYQNNFTITKFFFLFRTVVNSVPALDVNNLDVKDPERNRIEKFEEKSVY